MPHLSELHGAATHLAVVAIPLYAVLLLLRRAGIGTATLTVVSPWVLGFALLGVALAGVTGLLVWGQAQQELRGNAFRIGSIHFWLGIGLAVVVLVSAALGWRAHRAGHELPRIELLAFGVLALAMVAVQGYLGGRMTYEHGVGVEAAGEFAQTATGSSRLQAALAKRTEPAVAGKAAFSRNGLGCASCHGDQAQGMRGPRLAGGRDLEDFRRVHAHGLFPPQVVTDGDFEAINAWLRTLRGGHR
jgi:uncharacterized membrane protein